MFASQSHPPLLRKVLVFIVGLLCNCTWKRSRISRILFSSFQVLQGSQRNLSRPIWTRSHQVRANSVQLAPYSTLGLLGLDGGVSIGRVSCDYLFYYCTLFITLMWPVWWCNCNQHLGWSPCECCNSVALVSIVYVWVLSDCLLTGDCRTTWWIGFVSGPPLTYLNVPTN